MQSREGCWPCGYPLSCPEPCPLTPRVLVSAHPLHFTFIRKPEKPTLANLLREGFSWKDIRQLTGLAGGWRTRLGTSRSQGLRTAGQCADSVPGPAPLDGHCWSFQSFQPLSEASHHSLQSQSPTEKGLTCQARVPGITLAQGRGRRGRQSTTIFHGGRRRAQLPREALHQRKGMGTASLGLAAHPGRHDTGAQQWQRTRPGHRGLREAGRQVSLWNWQGTFPYMVTVSDCALSSPRTGPSTKLPRSPLQARGLASLTCVPLLGISDFFHIWYLAHRLRLNPCFAPVANGPPQSHQMRDFFCDLKRFLIKLLGGNE